LGARAAGGAGLIIAEATGVEPRGRITPWDAGIWSDAHVEPLERVTRFIKLQGAVAGIQIAHAGRKASTDRPWEGGKPLPTDHPLAWQVIGPSALPYTGEHQTPQALTRDEIRAVQASFAAAAERAYRAGFEWLELHAAHGYLFHNFYSPLSNQRTDEYGGSFENRIRFLLETTEQVRAVWPERLPLTARLSCTDWIEGGWTLEETVELARRLKSAGMDLIDCSSGGNAPKAPVPVGPAYQVPLSEAVRRGAGIATAAVGMITAPAQADTIIRNGQADVVLLGREFLRDASWPLHAARTLGTPVGYGLSVTPPAQYHRAY
jgi:2,4-dienoyl-CoA reductase-like NADH-dependent reductase (Old Yellow Enzyme family)